MSSHPISEDMIQNLDRDLRILIETDGTLTRILRIVYNDEIDVKIINQCIGLATPIYVPEFGESAGRVLDRQILLSGRHSGIPFIAAESLIAVDLLPESITKVLRETNRPIGEVIAASRLETRKEPVAVCIDELPSWTGLKGYSTERARVVKRRYGIASGGQVVIVITEYFLRYRVDVADTKQAR